MGSVTWATEDGLQKDEHGRWLPPCIICGEGVPTFRYSRVRTYICDDCKKIIRELKAQKKKDKEEKLLSEGEKRFKKALQKLRKQGIDSTWDKAIPCQIG